MLALAVVAGAGAKTKAAKTLPQLKFDPSIGEMRTLTMPDGQEVNYTAYEGMFFVTNIEDSAYQTINVYVPEGATQKTPILLRTYVGGYMAAPAQQPEAGDATGRALKEGYVVAIPGSRGRNSMVVATKTDKKAGIKKEPLLRAMGAAQQRDDVFASVCYCPIIDLENADMAYEWLYNGTDSRQQGDAAVLAVSDELKAQFPAYLKSLNLYAPDGTLLTADNYLDYIKQELIRAAQIAKNAGADIPDSLGFTFSKEHLSENELDKMMSRDIQVRPPVRLHLQPGDYIIDLDMPTYLNYVVSTQPLKTAPAFDTQGVAGGRASGENEEFGDKSGSSVNFTDYSAAKTGSVITDEIRENVRLMNPMNFIGDGVTDVAPHWYIRHGARDRDTSFPIPINLALKLQNAGKDVNFLLAWNRPHSGDYALDELFEWIGGIVNGN